MPLAIESDHHSFADVQDRCAQKNEARTRCLCQQERVNDTCARSDLLLVARLGGHSAPRTDRDQVMTISKNLIQMVRNVGSWAYSYIGDASFDFDMSDQFHQRLRKQCSSHL